MCSEVFIPVSSSRPIICEDVSDVVRLLSSEFNHKRLAAVSYLGNAKEISAVEPLIECLREGSPEMRGEVIRALSNIGDARAVDWIISCLRDTDKSGEESRNRSV